MTFLRGPWSAGDVRAVFLALSDVMDPITAVLGCDVRTVDLSTGR